jgi:hypothetical protein
MTVEGWPMLQCEWIEGSRSFNIFFGATTAGICLLVAVPILWWVLPQHRRWFFSRGVDRHQRIQLAYGIFCMSMAFTDALCRFIPHPPLEWVHPAFFYTTVLVAFGIGPRVAYLLLRRRGTVLENKSAVDGSNQPKPVGAR